MKKIFMSALLLTGLGAVSAVKAQCGFNIYNNISFDVQLITKYDPGSGIPVFTPALTVPSGQSRNVNLNPCSGLIEQKVIDVTTTNNAIVLGQGLSNSFLDFNSSTVYIDWLSLPPDDIDVHY